MTRQINQEGFRLIANSEGCRLEAYLDAVGVPTIGYGHIQGVKLGQKITQQQADEMFRLDLQVYEATVEARVKVPINDNQFSALVSFTYNEGTGALASSTLLKRVNAGEFGEAANEFARWTMAGGRQLPGLVTRRAAEAALFRKPSVGTVAHPPVAMGALPPDNAFKVFAPADQYAHFFQIETAHERNLLKWIAIQLDLKYTENLETGKVWVDRK
jgi:lysozyme